MLPSNFRDWTPALRGAFIKGLIAAQDGKLANECPYQDKRKPSGKLSWSRSFINAWRDGWQYATQYPDDAKITMQYIGSYRKFS